MHSNPIIRTAKPGDAAALLDLYGHLVPGDEPCPIDLAKKTLAQFERYKGSAVLIGEADNQAVVTCTLIIIPNLTRGGAPYALIENVVTRPERRRQGYGKLVLDSATSRAWAHGCYKIMLSTGAAPPSTLAFYERAGFAQSRTGFQKRRLPLRQD